MSPWVIVYRSAWGLLIALFVVCLLCIFLPKCQALQERQQEKANLLGENNRLEQMARELKAKRERFSTDPAFVVRTAREAGMTLPDEVVFKFTSEPADAGN